MPPQQRQFPMWPLGKSTAHSCFRASVICLDKLNVFQNTKFFAMGQLRLKFLLKKAGLPAAVALYTLFHLKNKNKKTKTTM